MNTADSSGALALFPLTTIGDFADVGWQGGLLIAVILLLPVAMAAMLAVAIRLIARSKLPGVTRALFAAGLAVPLVVLVVVVLNGLAG